MTMAVRSSNKDSSATTTDTQQSPASVPPTMAATTTITPVTPLPSSASLTLDAPKADSNTNEQTAATSKTLQGNMPSEAPTRHSPTTLTRAPSLSELVHTMRSHNPDKWDRLAKLDTVTGSPSADKPTNSVTHPTSATTPLTAGTSPIDSPRLRLPARLATAPLLARSQSSNAVVQTTSTSSSGSPRQTTVTASSLETPPPRIAAPATFKTPGSKVLLNGRPLLPSGLPSLEAISKKIAEKQDKSRGAIATPSKKDDTTQSSSEASDLKAPLLSRSQSDSTVYTSVEPSLVTTALNDKTITEKEVAKKDSIAKPQSANEDAKAVETNSSATVSAEAHPLGNTWTLYFDSRATAKAAQLKQQQQSKQSGANAYEAGLQTLATIKDVESYCQLFNWLKKPSKMGASENLHLFKDNILPMWEDKRNQNGGKWTVQLDIKDKAGIDRCWTWLTMALIGQDFDGHEDAICGAVLGVRPRFFRLQIWLGDKDNVEVVNSIGKKLIELLELRGEDNESKARDTAATVATLDFTYHSGKAAPPPGLFVSIVSKTLLSSPSISTFSTLNGHSTSKVLSPLSGVSNSFNRPPGLARSNTTSSLANFALMNSTAAGTSKSGGGTTSGYGKDVQNSHIPDTPMSSAPSISWRDRLSQTKKHMVV